MDLRRRVYDLRRPHDEAALDDAIAESFPASDPPSWPSLTLGPPLGATSRYRLPAPPLLGVLPVARRVPQGMHVACDVALALIAGATAWFASSRRARVVAGLLAGASLTVSATTDTREAAARLVPLVAHEAFDHTWGAFALAAPLALGYARKHPLVAALQMACGAASIVVALVTDYRTAAHRADELR